MNIQVNYLGIPEIILEGTKVEIRQKKLENLFLYLLYHESIERDALVGVFWPDKNINQGKASLRNSLYQLRQLLAFDFFSNSTRDRICLSREITLIKDVDLLMDRDQAIELSRQKSFIFMENKELKDSEAFESWLLSTRGVYREIISGILRSKMEEAFRLGRTEEVLMRGHQYIKEKPYDEEALRILLRVYGDLGRYNEAFSLYRSMADRLVTELAVRPEAASQKLIERLKNEKNQRQALEGKSFQRSQLLAAFQERMTAFQEGAKQHLLLYGYPGSGRSHLVQEAIQDRAVTYRQVNLEPVDRGGAGALFSRWQKLYPEISLLPERAGSKFTIHFINNAQYLDDTSLRQIAHWSLLEQTHTWLILSLSRHFPYEKTTLTRIDNMELFRVPLLTLDETYHLLEDQERGSAYGLHDSQMGLAKNIHENTQGNFLFLRKKRDPAGIAAYFDECLASLSKDEIQLLQSLAIFPNGFDLRWKDYWQNETDQIQLLADLIHRGYLMEEAGLVRFFYSDFADFMKDQMPRAIKGWYHERAAQVKIDPGDMAEIHRYRAWHFGQAGSQGKQDYHQLKHLEEQLDYFDQMYPTKLLQVTESKSFSRDRFRAHKYLSDLTNKVEASLGTDLGEERDLLFVLTDYLTGRALISAGHREEGYPKIQRMISTAKQLGEALWLFKGLVELVHYSIQKEDLKLMEKSLAELHILFTNRELGVEYQAEYLRLAGLLKFFQGKNQAALDLYDQAIYLLDRPNYLSQCFLNLTGLLNYQAQALEELDRIEEAGRAFERAIALVKPKVHKCLDVLYSEYGHFLYRQSRQEAAGEYLEKAVSEYNYLGSYWKRPTTEVLLGEIALKQRDLQKARNHLITAQIYHRADGRPAEDDLINRLDQGIRSYKKDERGADVIFK